MSRALDPGLKEALKSADHGRVFSDVADVLAQPPDELLEIELLSNSHVVEGAPTLLRDGNAVGIPKLRLVQAFIYARKLLQRHTDGAREADEDVVWRATAVMLLMDPEHLTAANTRKRLLQRAIHDEVGDVAGLLRRERLFTDSLLTSRLHRHTKSPTLWNHRRWLLDQLLGLGLPVDALSDLRSVVFVSGERHPRNYYAWCHARYLVSMTAAAHDVTATMLAATKQWCLGHHDDISGWMFLAVLLQLVPTAQAVTTVDETLKVVEAFRWRNESVWYFLRNVLATEAVADALCKETCRIKESLLQGVSAGSQEQKALDQVG